MKTILTLTAGLVLGLWISEWPTVLAVKREYRAVTHAFDKQYSKRKRFVSECLKSMSVEQCQLLSKDGMFPR